MAGAAGQDARRVHQEKEAAGVAQSGRMGSVIPVRTEPAPWADHAAGRSGLLPHDPRGHATLILYDGGLQRVSQFATQLCGEA